MTPAQKRVITELERTGGNVDEVARELGTSASYIYRVKAEHWHPQDKALVPQGEQTLTHQADLLKAIIPPNTTEVIHLRDTTLDLLQTRVDDKLVTNDEAVKLLKALMLYEKALRDTLTPAANVINDNRKQTVTINALVSEFQKVDPQALRVLAGVPEPIIIEVKKDGQAS